MEYYPELLTLMEPGKYRLTRYGVIFFMNPTDSDTCILNILLDVYQKN